MPRPRRRALAFVLGVLFCVTTGLISTWFSGASTRTEDLNRDGRPDVWRAYGLDGRIASVAVDTNFDGRSDVEELYQNGILVRRQTDRDFDDQIDLVQDFDPATRQIVRSVTDVDADGVADLLVLFQNGAPVFSKWIPAARGAEFDRLPQRSPSARSGAPLSTLVDPFSDNLSLKPVRVDANADEPFFLPVPLGSPEAVAGPVAFVASAHIGSSERLLSSTPPLWSSAQRGPPVPFSSL